MLEILTFYYIRLNLKNGQLVSKENMCYRKRHIPAVKFAKPKYHCDIYTGLNQLLFNGPIP